MRFEGVRVFKLPFKRFKNGAAMTIPGIGIFVGRGWESNLGLLRHEFGHILQYRKWGFLLFWRQIAPDSLKSAWKAEKSILNHMETWTEWSANKLSFDYFNQPDNWNFFQFPIKPPIGSLTGKPKFTVDNDEFVREWLEG
ncbi:MAG: hypothetical protein GX102_11765 [Porphyromonadaceae bacterium]|jgi:hypothetical protein|nr:hypothetical protein [Porphyromonadaceae bacterium]